MKKIFILTGEPSGDKLASTVIAKLKILIICKNRVKLQQPLQKIMVPVLHQDTVSHLNHVRDLILSEVNVKELEIITEDNDILVKSIKPNFKTIGPKYGKHMKALASLISGWSSDDISSLEATGEWTGEVNGDMVVLDLNDFVINTKDIPGWLVSSEDGLTVALDISISEGLKSEGIAREVVNRVQNSRKEKGFDVTDRIAISIESSESIRRAIEDNQKYISDEVLANTIVFKEIFNDYFTETIEAENDIKFSLSKVD